MTAPTPLRDLHVPGRPLVLPNVWDADTARLVEAAGFGAVATSSVAVARSLGYGDGEQAPRQEMFAAAARIARAVSVPVTVDAESGYGLAPAEVAGRLLEAGAAGCNLEDTDHATGTLRPAEEQAERLAAVRAAAGGALVLNARIDVFLAAQDPRAVLADALDRARRYLEAGADCVYPIHLTDPAVIAEFTEAVRPAAVNVTYLPGMPGPAALAELGVARISLGGGLWQAARTWLKEHLAALARGTPPY
ncbi:isocitrate lyase/PEP mutase family protein [Prauserella muralis]|uniref:Carboxyvinyl-carboxyphosphonate phosphorylmutase n=1 Tax=Prauserella muralis TaxID=588067 RepID=A0A2V4ANN6_9PSEU|nr:isocitrate lyase/phosphoenolpyruvate mutase family protein [Prauserella muralis]PXY20736.1 carboxyvinyl-carboxyphosphonate phosphorylmutase [Prauserella muralis]TWE29743.1 2-methylisocitrate lyase-like PEP mutase family enzyme [Prauserella muralis]